MLIVYSKVNLNRGELFSWKNRVNCYINRLNGAYIQRSFYK